GLAAAPLQALDGQKRNGSAELGQSAMAILKRRLSRGIEDLEPRLLCKGDQIDIVSRRNSTKKVIATLVHPGLGRIGNHMRSPENSHSCLRTAPRGGRGGVRYRTA